MFKCNGLLSHMDRNGFCAQQGTSEVILNPSCFRFQGRTKIEFIVLKRNHTFGKEQLAVLNLYYSF